MKISNGHTQLFCEILLSIDFNYELELMIKNVVETYARNSTCAAAGILRLLNTEQNGLEMQTIFVMPLRENERNAFSEAKADLQQIISYTEPDEIKYKLPIAGDFEEKVFYHILDLPNFGFLFLFKHGQAINSNLISELVPLNQKIADACLVSLERRILKEREDELILIAEATQDTIFLSGTLLYLNKQMVGLLGYPPEEMIGATFSKFVPEKDLKKFRKALKDIFTHKKFNSFDAKLIHADGHRVPVEIDVRLARQGDRPFARGTIRDITERVQNK